jgi:hypothetical protein
MTYIPPIYRRKKSTMQVSIDRDQFIGYCDNCIRKNTEDIAKLVNDMIKTAMTPRTGFWGKIVDFFSPPPSSAEDAMKYVQRTDWYIWNVYSMQNEITKVRKMREMAVESAAPFVVITPSEHFLLAYKI